MWSCAVILHHLTKLIYQLNEESIFLIIFKDNSKFNLMSCLVSKIQVASFGKHRKDKPFGNHFSQA